MALIWAVAAAGGGALLGPALRARIFRHAVPAETRTRTACPHCDSVIVTNGWRGLITTLPPSGRCPSCRGRVGPALGTVEAATAVVFALLTFRVTGMPQLAAFYWVAAVGVALGFVDAAVHRLPDRLTLPAFVGSLALLTPAAIAHGQPGRIGLAVACGLALAGCYATLIVSYPAGLGLGDMKLALSLGLLLGWFGGAATVLGGAAGFLFAGGYAAILLALGRASRQDQIPHGPFMLVGALTTVLLL